MLVKEYEQVLNNMNRIKVRSKKIFILVNYQLSITKYCELLRLHSNLKITNLNNLNLIQLLQNHEEILSSNNVLIINIQLFNEWLNRSYITINDILLIIFDDVHNIFYNINNKLIYENIMSKLATKPHLVGFGTLILGNLHNQNNSIRDLDKNLEILKNLFECQIEFASDLLNTQNLLNGIKNVEKVELCDAIIHDDFSKSLLNILNGTLSYISDLNLVEYKRLNQLSSDIDCIHIICLKCINECIYMLNTIGIWCLTKSLLPIICQLDKLAHYLISSQTPYYELVLLLQYMTSKLRLLRELCIKQIIGVKHRSGNKQEFNDTLINKLSTSKVKKLVQILHSYKASQQQQFCCLLYVKNKQTAITLSLLLKKLSKEDVRMNFISPNYVINNQTLLNEENNLSLDDSNLSNNAFGGIFTSNDFLKQEEILRKFHSGEINLLICTFEMEEFIDVPQSCNLIIRFDCDYFNYYSYILSKTRLKSSKCENKIVYICEQYQMNGFLKKFKNIKQLEFLLENKYSVLIRRLNIFNRDVKCSNSDSSLIYYPNEENKTISINLVNSIELLNRYCIRLPSDALTQLTPHYRISYINGAFNCKLTLPINSCLRGHQFQSNGHPTVLEAYKMIAYLICCKLVEINELNTNLEPITKEYFYKQQLNTLFSDKFLLTDNFDELSEDFSKKSDQTNANKNNYRFSHSKTKQQQLLLKQQQEQHQMRTGSSKRKQIYKKKISNYLTQSPLDTQHQTYLYRFKCDLTTPLNTVPLPTSRSQKEKCFAIITQKRLLEVPDYTIFTQYGEESICIDLIKENFYLTQNQIKLIKSFHKFLFSYVLRMERPPVVFQSDSLGAFICLVTQVEDFLFEIDWSLMRLVENYNDKSFIKPIVDTTTFKTENVNEEEENFVFHEDLYRDAVIIPYYRYNDYQPQFYCVQSIDTTLNPQSKFPSNNVLYQTFYDYYSIKYNKIIRNQSQPMLVVQHPSTRLNLLTPRYMNLKASVLQKSVFFANSNNLAVKGGQNEMSDTNAQNTLISKSTKIYLVPELVNIHPFSCTLWKRCLSLPSILYRLNSLLVCEELRRDIAQSTNVGVPWIENDFKFDKLEFNWDFKKEIEISHIPDQEFDINGKNPNNMLNEMIDNAWNFEISEWSTSDAYTIPNSQNTHHQENENNWFENFDQTKTLFLDTNDLVMFEDEYDEDDDDDDERNDNWKYNDSDGGEDVNYNDEENDEQIKTTKINNSSSKTHQADKTEGNKFIINLNNLKADLKRKSAKLLSKLNVSNKEMKQFFISNSTTSESVESIDDTTSGEDMNEDLIKFFNETQIMYLKQNKLNLNFESSKVVNINECNTFDLIEKDENDEYGNWLQNVEINFNKETALCETIELIEKLKLLKTKLKNTIKLLDTDVQMAFNFEDSFMDRLNTYFKLDDKFIELEDSTRAGIINPVALNLKFNFNLDYDHDDDDHEFDTGPGPALLLQALTLSNANDGFNLERLETIGDSFLKKAITVYLFSIYSNTNEGKLSYLRSKQVSNYNLYKLGKRRNIHELIHASKFEPFDTWLPIHYDAVYSSNLSFDDLFAAAFHKLAAKNSAASNPESSATQQPQKQQPGVKSQHSTFDKYKMHLVSDKSIADSVEAIIGAYLIKSGPKAALRVMYWFGLQVLPKVKLDDGSEVHIDFALPSKPDIKNYNKLNYLLNGYENFENTIGYKFQTRAYLLQAFTHASYIFNDLTDCYQRLEFLGDAILDYVITRHLYEDPKKHSPGELTDLRSALVNNNIFSYLAVKFEYYKYFKYLSPQLFLICDNFVKNYKKINDDDLDENFLFNYSIDTDEEDDDIEFADYVEQLPASKQACEEQISNNEFEELEVPKVLGDIFESVAGAIFLDSNKSLETVWKVYYTLMKPYIEKYTEKVPKSPIRELLELEPETAKFEKPERTIDGKIRVTVNVFGKGKFKGIGRNYRIAKNAAAKLALKFIHKQGKHE